MYQDVQNSQFQSTVDPRMKKGVSNQETCQERKGEVKSPKIPYYDNDSSPEELKPGSGIQKLLLIVLDFRNNLQLCLGMFVEAIQKVSPNSKLQKMIPWEVNRIYLQREIHLNYTGSSKIPLKIRIV